MPKCRHVHTTRMHGCDIYCIDDIEIKPFGNVTVSTGWKCIIPNGYAMIIKEKSGIASKRGVDVGACVVDSGYLGFVHVNLINNTDKTVKFERGRKIAQFIVVPVWTGQPKEVSKEEFEKLETDRGNGGFGSTGV